MGYSKQWFVGILRSLGYSQVADEALRVLPDDFDRRQLEEFADRHGISRDEVISRMGGSP
jgi:hypothetical protein